jgi:protein-S-isoprenylcysteine O-methyltransferase Ste14
VAEWTWQRIARRIRVPLGFVFAAVYLWLAKPIPESIALGAVIAACGLALRAAAAGHVKKDQALTTSGPYAHTRNPLYLGSILIAAGFTVASRSWWVLLVVLLLLVFIYLPVIRSEEQYLRGRFPEFDDYARRVPRLLPKFTSQGEQTPFSAALYRKHREYNALIGAVAMLLALLAKWAWVGRAIRFH